MPQTNPSTLRVLVLDDDPVMRDLLDALLSLEGHEVQVAETGEEAMTLLRSDHALDLVLTDVQLPGLAGTALAHGLRGVMPQEALLIGMSGSDVPEEAQRVYDAFVSKPFDMQLLGDTIDRAKRHSRHANEPFLAHAGVAEVSHDGAGAKQTETLNMEIFGSLAKLIPAAKLQELFALTLDDIQKRHLRMEAAAAQGDLLSVQREAHAVKGSCGMVGAAELQLLASNLEGGTTVDTEALEEMPRAMLRLRRMLETKLQTS